MLDDKLWQILEDFGQSKTWLSQKLGVPNYRLSYPLSPELFERTLKILKQLGPKQAQRLNELEVEFERLKGISNGTTEEEGA